jgi:hypothetical protein
MHADGGYPARIGQRPADRRSHQEGTGQARPRRVGDAAEGVFLRLRLLEGLLNERQQLANVIA